MILIAWLRFRRRLGAFVCLHHLFHRSTVKLIAAKIQIFDHATTIQHEACRPCDVDGFYVHRNVDAVALGNFAVFIEQERVSSRLPFEEFLRLEDAATLLGSHKDQGTASFDLLFVWLILSHALYAVWSPRAAKEFDYCRPALEHVRERKCSRTIRGAQGEIRRLVADLQSVSGSFVSQSNFPKRVVSQSTPKVRCK